MVEDEVLMDSSDNPRVEQARRLIFGIYMDEIYPKGYRRDAMRYIMDACREGLSKLEEGATK